MSDLSEKQSGGNTKIVGADPDTGAETFFLNVTSEGEAKISSFANISFDDVVKVVGTSEVLVAVGGLNLSNRKGLRIVNNGPQTIYWGKTGVDNTKDAIEKDESLVLEFGDNIDVYVITNAATANVLIQEWS